MFEGPAYDLNQPLVHIDWEITPDEWQELRGLLLAAPRTPFIEGLIANGALGSGEALHPEVSERQFLAKWAAENKAVFEDEGEIGFGRECVGIVKDGQFLSYERCREARPPNEVPDAYHKGDFLAVLGRGEDAIHQLYLWVMQLATRDIGIEVMSRTPDDVLDVVLQGFTRAYLTKKTKT